MKTPDTHHAHSSHDTAAKVVFGFWTYIMTDFIMFAALFATYSVLHNNTYGGPGITQMASLEHVLLKTLIFLLSSFTCSLMLVGLAKEKIGQIRFWMLVTFVVGLGFLGVEYHQQYRLVEAGITWQGSAFLSVYFTLIGAFCVHLAIALLWIIILMVQLRLQGLTETMKTRFSCLGLFWHFLTLVWILIFTIVYLAGAI